MALTRKAFLVPLLILGMMASNMARIRFAEPVFQEGQDLSGSWQGVLSAGGNKLRLGLRLTKAADGTFAAVVDSPDQGAMDLPVDTVAFKDNRLRFEMKQIGAIYEGAVNRDRTEIIGSWTQGSFNAPLIFRREGEKTKPLAFERGRMKLEPCNLAGLTQEARCGKYEVFEDRAAKSGRKIALNLLVLPATGEKPAPDPIFFLAGGPGQGAVSVIAGAGDYLSELRGEREIVFIDQRGTGKSNPLNCEFYRDRDDMRGYFGEPYPADILRSCRAELEKVANLALYTTPIAMDDLDEVRAALGYERINLFGGSYGTNAALVYLRQYPSRVRSVVLKGVAPTDYKLPLAFSKGVQHALDRLMEDCAANQACQKAFPKLKEEFMSVLARLDKTPASFDVVNPLTRQTQHIEMSRAAFVDGLRLMLYVPELSSMLPLIIHRTDENDYVPFATYAFDLIRQIGGQLAKGMQLSVLCAEHIPFITEADLAREAKGTYYGDARARSYRRACEAWPSVKAPASFLDPVKSDVPVLMVNGDIDPVTPPVHGAAAARTLPNSRHVVIRNGTHLTNSACIDNLIAQFISKGTAQGLDASCVNDIKRPPFILEFPVSFARPASK